MAYKIGDRIKVESKDGVHEGMTTSLQKIKTIIFFIIFTIVLFAIFPAASANHLVGFYADKNGYWSGGVKYYVHETSDVQFNVEDNGGDGLSLINGGVIVYYKNPNTGKDELVAVQCNQEELQNPDGICNNYDIAQNGKLAWAWDQKYYSGNLKKDDADGDGQNDFVTAGKYYGIIITVPHKNYAAGTTQYETQTFVLDADDDGDAVPNGADKCLQTFGSGAGEALGCPDGDNDGVPDEKDKCLEKAETINGYLDSDGCPDELFAGGPPQGRFTCSTEECKQIALKNEARREAQVQVILAAASTLIGIPSDTKTIKETPPGKFPKVIWPIAFGLEVVSDYFTVKSAKEKIEQDPADPNYKVTATLKQTQVKLLEGGDEQTKIVNALFLAGRDYADAVGAFVAVNEKYLGAKEANDKYWMDVHLKERKKYAALAAATLRKYTSAITETEIFIMENDANHIITKEQLVNFQNELKTTGIAALPQEEIKMLKDNLGGNDFDVQNLANNVLNIDPATWIDEPIVVKIENAKNANENLSRKFDDFTSNKNQQLFLAGMFITFAILICCTVMWRRRNKHD